MRKSYSINGFVAPKEAAQILELEKQSLKMKNTKGYGVTKK